MVNLWDASDSEESSPPRPPAVRQTYKRTFELQRSDVEAHTNLLLQPREGLSAETLLSLTAWELMCPYLAGKEPESDISDDVEILPDAKRKALMSKATLQAELRLASAVCSLLGGLTCSDL